ncbi:MAG: DNA repair protein RadA [Desulfovibrionales bacterium]
MAREKQCFVCTACGALAGRWQGQCAQCGEWNRLEEQVVRKSSQHSRTLGTLIRPVPLNEGLDEGFSAISTGIQGLDEVLGKGLVSGGVTLLGGEPGIGKSTLLLQLCAEVASKGNTVVYVSGEESLGQLGGRAARLRAKNPSLMALATMQAEHVLPLFEEDAPALVVIDSIQMMSSSELDGLPGSVNQVRAVATMLSERAKTAGTALILVGHVTKEGQIAGPKLLEHMVDTVLYLEGDRDHLFRLLRVIKNRFGPSNELLVLQMTQQGLDPVQDPSTFFLQTRNETLSGSAVVMTVDGNRPFAVEVQALASRSYLAIPRRTSLGLDSNRLNLLLAVMEKHLKLTLGQMDIYAKIGGGLQLRDPGLDLGLVGAVLSSIFDRPLPEKAIFWGEVDLNGQIRPVFAEDIRRRQAGALGYDPILCAGSKKQKGCATLLDFQRKLFGK